MRTFDGTLSRFGPEGSEPRRTRRLARTDAQLVVAGDQVVVVDSEEGGTATQVQALSSDTGEVIQATEPTCEQDPDLAEPFSSVQSSMVVVPGATDVVTLSGMVTGCVVRFDPATGEQAWAVELPERFDSFDGDRFLIDEQYLVVDLPGGLTSVDLASGEAVTLAELPDLRADPVRIVDGTLIAETTTERGTPRLGLAGFDLTTGRSLWTTETGLDQTDVTAFSDPRRVDGRPFDQASQRVLVTGSGGETQVLTFSSREAEVFIRPLDLVSGALGEIIDLDYSDEDRADLDLSVAIVEGGDVLVDAEGSLRLVPLSDGAVRAWPDQN